MSWVRVAAIDCTATGWPPPIVIGPTRTARVGLRFTEGALRAVAQKATERKSGARGLRSILEVAMLDLMYDIPSRNDVEECVVNEEVIQQGNDPLLVFKQEAESA